MYKLVPLIKYFILLTFFIASNITLANEKISPTLWQIEKSGVTSYLLGTVHLGDAEMAGLPKKVINALQKSKEVVVEVNLNQFSPLEIQQKSMQYMMLPAGKSLSTELSKNNYTKLKQHLAAKGIDIKLMEQVQPWGVMLTVTMMEYQNAGFSEANGIDKQVLRYAEEHQITISDLETLDQQLSMFNKFAHYNNQMVSDGLKELANMDKYFKQLITSWKKGDDQALEQYYKETFSGDSYSALTEKVLLSDRNSNWVKQLKQPLTKKPHFIAVGALHLTSTNGLVALLRSEGFKVSKL